MTIEEQGGRNPVEELAEEFLARYRLGERPAVSEYASRYPALADEIQELFPALVVLEEAGPREGDRPSAFGGRITADGRTPSRLGEYRILREVGRGGMGVVYEAVQEPLGRHVALKVLPYDAAADPTCLKRFTREARAAARLHHTNIVPVFDVGEHEGVHYYAMQFIQGQGLDEVLAELRRVRLGKETLADDRSRQITAGVLSGEFAHAGASVISSSELSLSAPLSPRSEPSASTPPSPRIGGRGQGEGGDGSHTSSPTSESIASSAESGSQYFRSVTRLGLQAAEALAYAHGERVLHRDIKPSNLLLDVYGRLWVMDFGLAKDDSEDITRAGDVVGTLRYMAPERFSGSSDLRADVYSLGLTLYELLTLRPAFEETDRARLVRRITREDPARPRRIDRHIPRDLETIVLKAITKEPDRRYQTAEVLAEDLRRFLADRPILARRTSWAGHAWRWCRRNPMVASLLAVIGLILAGSVIGLTGLYLNANRERRRAESAEEKWKVAAGQAEQEAVQARRAEADTKAVLDFFQKRVLSAAAPKGQHGGLGREATIRAAVDQAAPTITPSFAARPLVEASIRQVLGHTYFFAGDWPAAIEQHQRALALRSMHLGPDGPDTLKSMVSLAQDYDADGRRGEALKLYRQALVLCQTKLGPNDSETLWSMRGVAKGLLAEGRVADALPLYEEALKRAKVALGPNNEDTLIYMSNLANAYRSAGRLAEAIPLFQQTIKLETITLGPDHPDTLITMNDLGFAYVSAARFAEAALLFRETSKVMKKTLGPDHPQTLITMNNLAVAYREGGQLSKALPLLEETLRLKKAKQGPEHESTLITMGHLATAYADVGRLSEAFALFEDTLNRQKATLGADYSYRLYFMNQAGACLLKMKKFDQARALLSDCLALRTKKDPNDWWIFQTKSQLGQALAGQKKHAEAEKLLLEGQKGLADRKATIPPRYHRNLGEADRALAKFYEAQGRSDKAQTERKK